MRICHVAERMCTRVMKESIAQQEAGHEIEICTRQPYYAYEGIHELKLYISPSQLGRTIKNSNADIFHVHNEGDWLVKVVKEASGGRPVVFDCHDLNSLLDEGVGPMPDEIDAFQYADGFCHVSEGHKNSCEQRHGNSKPAMVLPSYMQRRFLAPLPLPEPCWKGICYEGGVSIDQRVIPLASPNGSGIAQIQVQYRAYHSIVRKFTEQGYNFYLFPAEELPLNFSYTQVGGVLVDPVPYPTMLLALRIFGFGLCGSALKFELMEASLPNKLFEYMSQGVVPVVFNSAETARFVKEHDIGIVLEGLEDLPSQLARGPEIRENILAKREEFVMEEHIGELVNFYEQLLNSQKGRKEHAEAIS